MSDGQPSAVPRIFLNYRRTDAPGHAGRIYDALVRHLGDEHVFMDVDDIPPGRSFLQVLDEALATCDVLLALIGPQWLARSRRLGRRRLDDPDDFVRLEIGRALQRGIIVIPVLIQGARMPTRQDLPEPVAPLADVQAFEMTDRRWGADMRALLAMLDGVDVAALRTARARAQPPSVVGPRPPETAAPVAERVVPRHDLHPPPPGSAGRSRGWLVGGSVAAAVVLVVSVVVAIQNLGGNTGGTTGPSTDPQACDTSRGTLAIGMVAPLSGGLSALGLGMSHSADLAVDQANAECIVPGYQLVFQAEDDQATPQVAGQVATKLASDPNVVGVVGTLNSSTSQTVQPILADRSIVQVSPANTNPTLTLGEDPTGAPKRPFASYFRVSTTDLIQGPFGAQYLVQKAGKKNIAVIDDGKTYGAGLAATFAQEAEKLGATVVAREKVGERDTDFSGVIAKIRPANPDAVYYGGEYPAAGPLSGQLAGAGLNIPLMGGDGLIDPQYIALGGRAGDLATNVGAPAASLPSAKQFIADYQAANYAEPFGAYGVPTYDATNVIIDALAKAVQGGTWSEDTRQTVVSNVQATNLSGASGPISFDEFGDTTNKVLTVYTVKGDNFAPVAGSTGSFS